MNILKNYYFMIHIKDLISIEINNLLKEVKAKYNAFEIFTYEINKASNIIAFRDKSFITIFDKQIQEKQAKIKRGDIIPIIPFNISKEYHGQGIYKFQTGSPGMYGNITLSIKPNPNNQIKINVDRIYNTLNQNILLNRPYNHIDEYINQIEAGIVNGCKIGLQVGSPITNADIEVINDKFHPVDGIPRAYKYACIKAIQNAIGHKVV